ncbi:DUF1707 domain-containing protein [Streptomyces sp. VRA16 Mangrove soil]|uniref:DUF1707 SHOCT-like domain-containing protein n=1 Tax=Streptomyces sp. VRA16 Mangrove soil TaxID=2817434 RepID=UPI001A9CBF6B|nr:DUF1707 domain-containing protein [Streptomyces sp. VRA16 Mangrove soil]MBO1337711.1 DUF1707 and DUF2154 domain-containing protein [Streptomyces sp. VRA16 Mangrove soil]
MTDASLPDRPDDTDPADAALDLRASDADREQVAERLRDAMAEGRLDMDEFNERLEETYKARTYRDLAPLTRDLPGAGAPAPAPVAPTPVNLVKGPLPEGAVDWASRIGGQAGGTAWGVGVLSGFERRGRWTVPRRMDCVAVMGGGELDLREANFEDREVTINCVAIMGGVNVIVPPGVEVVVRGIGIMGGFDHRESGVPGEPGAPRVIVTGFAFWGGVGVERKLPKAERQRLKEERRREKLDRREDRRELLGDRHHRLHEDRLDRHRERMEEHLDRLEERRERRQRRHWD